ncbi:hypothetical protein BC833DRAFT_195650 [Globomyces pollinis-pini]|nr:hypothetical protein BC833DRAFT_195650 [Globomyces pollinis-pini]
MNKTSCFDCRATGCDNLGKCNFGVCQCLDGFGDLDCTKPLCGKLSDTPINRPISNLKDQCQCGDGFTGVHCNVCTNDDVCRFLPGAPLEIYVTKVQSFGNQSI